MKAFEVRPSGLATAARGIQPVAGAVSGMRIPEADPAMYGPLVGSAAADCEPATTQAFNELLPAVGALVGDVASRLDASSECYVAAEESNVATVAAVRGLL